MFRGVPEVNYEHSLIADELNDSSEQHRNCNPSTYRYEHIELQQWMCCFLFYTNQVQRLAKGGQASTFVGLGPNAERK